MKKLTEKEISNVSGGLSVSPYPGPVITFIGEQRIGPVFDSKTRMLELMFLPNKIL